MKEQSDLQPIVDTYREYKKNKETIQDSIAMLEEKRMKKCGKCSKRSCPMRRKR